MCGLKMKLTTFQDMYVYLLKKENYFLVKKKEIII